MDRFKQDNVSMFRALGIYEELLEDLKCYKDYSRDYLLSWGGCRRTILFIMMQSERITSERRKLYKKAYDNMIKMKDYE